jgi:hypothetical protein
MASTDPFYKIVKGYPKLAAKIEIQPEIAIYRRFGALNAQNLLYLQAELEMLEIKLRDQQIQDDNDRNGKGPDYAKDWYWLRESENSGNDKQLRIVLQIRASLKAYSKLAIVRVVLKSLTPYRRCSDSTSHNSELPKTGRMGPTLPSRLPAHS